MKNLHNLFLIFIFLFYHSLFATPDIIFCTATDNESQVFHKKFLDELDPHTEKCAVGKTVEEGLASVVSKALNCEEIEKLKKILLEEISRSVTPQGCHVPLTKTSVLNLLNLSLNILKIQMALEKISPKLIPLLSRPPRRKNFSSCGKNFNQEENIKELSTIWEFVNTVPLLAINCRIEDVKQKFSPNPILGEIFKQIPPKDCSDLHQLLVSGVVTIAGSSFEEEKDGRLCQSRAFDLRKTLKISDQDECPDENSNGDPLDSILDIQKLSHRSSITKVDGREVHTLPDGSFGVTKLNKEGVLGVGTNATVYRGQLFNYLDPEYPVRETAVVVLNKQNDKEKTREVQQDFLKNLQTRKELGYLPGVQPPPLAILLEGKQLRVHEKLFDYPESDVLSYLQKHGGKEEAQGKQKICGIISRVIEGVGSLHGANYTHRDLKLNNIFLMNGEDGLPLAFIGDLGSIKSVKEGPATETKDPTLGMTMGYFDKACIQKEQTDFKSCDMFALGVVMWQLKHQTTELPAPNFFRKILLPTQGKHPIYESVVPSDPLDKLIYDLTDPHGTQRLTIKEVANRFRSSHWCDQSASPKN